MMKPPRPIGVTLIAIVQILVGVIGLLASLAIIGVAALLSTLPAVGGLLAAGGLVIGGVVLFFSIIWLATGVGFLHGRGWAWTLGMIFTVLSVLGAGFVLYLGIYQAVYGLVFWIIMIVYLTRSHVKVFFGKGTFTGYTPALASQQTMRYATTMPLQTQYAPAAPPSLAYSPAMAAPAQTPVVATATAKCKSCGMPLAPGTSFCTNCGSKQ